MKSPWPTKKLEGLIEERKEKNLIRKSLPVFTVSHIYGLIPYQNIFYKRIHSIDTSNYKIVRKFDFAFGLPTKDTLPFGLLEQEEAVLVSPAYIVFSIKDRDKLYPKFLSYLFKTNQYKRIIIEKAKSQGATRHGLPLKFNHLSTLEIPLPPLPIQKKVVSILDTIQEAINIQNKIIETTKELKKSMMADLFKYGGPSFRKGRKLKKTEIGEIPEDWEVVRLREIAYIKGGKRLPKGHVFSKEKTGYPYIRVIDFKNGGIDSANLQYLKKEDYELLKNYSISKNDIYISIAGTVGLVGIIPEELDGAVLTENAAKLVIKNSTKFNKLFLVKFLTSDKGQNQIKSLTSKSTQPKLGLYRIAQIKIPLPPLPEQREIAEILQTIDQKIEIEQKKKELYEELFKTMLNKIFTGEIDIEKIEI
ncbi:MAG: restriction endonuclease subunit S [Candidatus Aenigmatarchaeota archaeon]